jgi:hypothetical protein
VLGGTLLAASSSSITVPPSSGKICGRSFSGARPTSAIGQRPTAMCFDGATPASVLAMQLIGGVGVGGGSREISWRCNVGGRAGPCNPVVVEEATGMAIQGREGAGKGQVGEVRESKRRR